MKSVRVFLLVFCLMHGWRMAWAGEISVDAGRGSILVQVPSDYQPTTPAPLLILLHGYTSSGAETEAILQFAPEADARGLIYAFPDGTQDPLGNRFWNATDACCNFLAARSTMSAT